MNLLLDTHVLLWYAVQGERLTASARAAVMDAQSNLFLSTASIWELSIKYALGKLPGVPDVEGFIQQNVTSLNLIILPIESRHAYAVARLPLLHGDPFDRMLIAQATINGLTLVTNDRHIMRYNVPYIW